MGLNTSIKSLVRREVPQVQDTDMVDKVIDILANNKVPTILVFSGEKLAGVISDTDLISCIAEGEDASLIEIKTVMTPCQMADQDGTLNPCAQIDEDESVLNALLVFEMSGTHGLVVATSDPKIPGIICLRDVLAEAIK